MFNKSEVLKILKSVGKGAAIGGILCIVLFIYELFADLFNCFCNALSGENWLPDPNSDILTFVFIFGIGVAIGLIVGFFMALKMRSNRIAVETKTRLEKEEKELNAHLLNNQKEIAVAYKNFINYAERSADSIHKPFKEIHYYEQEKNRSIKSTLERCKQAKVQTEKTMNSLINKGE